MANPRPKTKKVRSQDLMGRVFGRWTVLELASVMPRKWLCRCVCGAERAVAQHGLLNRRSQSCGCHGHDLSSMHKLKDELGKVYNSWTVLSLGENSRNGAARWWCRCDCGQDYLVKAGKLRNGESTQCRSCAAKARMRRQKAALA